MTRLIAWAALLVCILPAGCGQTESPAGPSTTAVTAAPADPAPATGVTGATNGFAALAGGLHLDGTQAPIELPLKLPVSVWLDAQPLDVTTAWHDPATRRSLTLDGFGTRARYFGIEGLGTTFDGSVTVRAFGATRAHVAVILHTRNAICWGYQGDETETHFAEAFGYAPFQVAAGATPSLGDGLWTIEFLIPWPTDHLPTYHQTQPDDPVYPRLRLSAVVNCRGALRPGSGHPDGTPGAARTTQVGLFATGTPGGCPHERNANCYPSERIDWWPVGVR